MKRSQDEASQSEREDMVTEPHGSTAAGKAELQSESADSHDAGIANVLDDVDVRDLLREVFDESDKSIVVMGLEIASFTYGGLLGLFLLTKIERDFSQVSLISGLVASMLIVFVMKSQGLAWTWFIGFSVLTNLVVVYLVDTLVKLRSDQ